MGGAEAGARRDSRVQPARVLLIEDDEEDFILVRNLIKRPADAWIELVWRQSLRDGLADLRAGACDIALADLSFPDSPGEDTFNAVRAAAGNVPFIVLTGLDDESVGIRATREGAQDYLVKGSLTRDQLIRSIRYSIARHKAEEALKLYSEQLEQLVYRRTADLRDANEKLNREIGVCAETERNLREAVHRMEEQDRARSQFVANVSHELKTPLVSLRYAAGNLLEGVAGEIDDRAREYVEMMRHDCERMLRTVNDILDLSGIETRRLILHMAVMPLDWCADRAVEPLRMQARSRGVVMETSLQSRSFVNCDSAKLERVLVNVVHNAIKFSREGGKVGVVTRRVNGQSGHEVEVVVSDSGIGIPAEHLPHIGERFYRVGDQVSGSGLGMYISKELVKEHGGSLDVASPPPGQDSGAMVTLRLPVAEPPLIVVVDDDDDCRRLLEMQVGRAGYRVHACASGEQTIEAVRNELPAALILDLIMPGMDGFGTITRIRSEPRWRLLPLLAITGGTLSPEKRSLLEGFGVPAVRKPWEAAGLIGLLQETIWGHSYLRATDR